MIKLGVIITWFIVKIWTQFSIINLIMEVYIFVIYHESWLFDNEKKNKI